MKILKKYFLGILFLLLGSHCYSGIVPVDSDRWEFFPDKYKRAPFESYVEDYLGQKSLVLNQGYSVVRD